jgi:hypothetical protein
MTQSHSGISSALLWKFLTREDGHGTVWWSWELFTPAGHFVTSSARQFLMLTECEEDAKLNGYIAPEKRDRC